MASKFGIFPRGSEDMDAPTVQQPVVTPGWRARKDFRDARIHMVGIGGSGMCGLAAVLIRRGARVTGTDRIPTDVIERLRQSGARIAYTQSAETVPADAELVVASAAVPSSHPELAEARRRGVPTLKYAQFLGLVMAQHQGIAIAGTHGKSTTTAWTTYVLRKAGLDPSFVVGADVEQLDGGSGVGDGPHFVAESCEYDRSFLNLAPRIAAILNIEEDHLDYYENIEQIVGAFGDFARLVPADGLLVLNGEDANCARIAERTSAAIETFGLGEGVTWRAVELNLSDGRYEFGVERCGKPLGKVSLGLPGRHNVLNALAVIAIATNCGVSWPVLREALAKFHGARRRLELRGSEKSVTVCDDYAHHPTEIRATLRAARERFSPKRLWCVFQPHQHSRTRFLIEDFAQSFEQADRVVVPSIYFVRDSERERDLVCSEDLVERIRARGVEASYVPEFSAIVSALIEGIGPGDLVITMGAGDIWKVADELVRRLRADLPV
ncbi:MAG: UDP-N-acetylmuramate--L-alanine ligase [Planctomycetes bacterium]|nr:UDP-N-acetylmuramate--L-alanine ligase [Planctomycetota bacterium]